MKQGRKISIVSRMFAVLLAVMMVCSNISIPSKAAETVQTIAAWEYKDKDSAPSSLPAGATSGSGQLNVTGATYTGYSSKSLAANNWEEEGSWTISEINAEKYENFMVTWGKMYKGNMAIHDKGLGRRRQCFCKVFA